MSKLLSNTSDWIRAEFLVGYSLFETLFLLLMVAAQFAVYHITDTGVISLISGVSGAISVVLCAKGKISFYYVGFIQTGTYLVLSLQHRLYGEVIENIFYLVTMVIGIVLWRRRIRKDSKGAQYVEAQKFTAAQWGQAIIFTIIGTWSIGYMLTMLHSSQAYTDAATNVMAVFAQLLMIKRYREQWLWWFAIDMFCMKIWFVEGDWCMFAMYAGWTLNTIYGWYNWSKLNKQQGNTHGNS